MDPVLLKPGSGTRASSSLLGQPVGEHEAGQTTRTLQGGLLARSPTAFADLRRRFDVVICEGAGSPAEVNLRAPDIANMGFARAADLPVLVVGDIDRGGRARRHRRHAGRARARPTSSSSPGSW